MTAPRSCRLRALFGAFWLAVAAGCSPGAASSGVSCIAPANPGGGWDLTCRAAAEVLSATDSLATELTVENMPGEGGGVAFARVAGALRANERVIVAASPSTLLGLAQRHFGELTERDVRWVAALGAEPSVVAVRAGAPWRTLGEFVTDWSRRPEEIRSGGVSVSGGQDHIKMLLLARAAGIELQRVRYSSLSGPAEAIDALRDGTIQVFPGDASEVRAQVAAGELRVLAVLGERRAVGILSAVPTAREQGFDVTWDVWRGFYAPPGISDSAYRDWIERLRIMSASPQWKALLDRNAMTPFFIAGPEFEKFVGEQTAAFRAVSQAIGIIE